MRERLPVHEVGWTTSYRAERLDHEECLSGYMEAAAEEGVAGVLDALPDVALARLINQMAPATGIDRLRLCAALDGGPGLTEEEAGKVLEYFGARVPAGTPAAVG